MSWSSKKGGGKSKKEAPPKTVVKHLDEDEVQFILMLDSKASANINTTAETVRSSFRSPLHAEKGLTRVDGLVIRRCGEKRPLV